MPGAKVPDWLQPVVRAAASNPGLVFGVMGGIGAAADALGASQVKRMLGLIGLFAAGVFGYAFLQKVREEMAKEGQIGLGLGPGG